MDKATSRRRPVAADGDGAAGLLNLVYWPIWTATEGVVASLLVGYWMWAASFLGAALGLWMLAMERASAPIEPELS